MKLDDALTLLGSYGKYQVLVYLAISIFDNFISIWHMSVMAFLGFENRHHCKVPPGADINKTIPRKYMEGSWSLEQCTMHSYDNVTATYSNGTVPCTHGWYYDTDPIISSVVSEWDLVCARNVLPETSQMVFNFGVMFGALLFGFLSDKFGRKKSFIFACVIQAVVGSVTAAAHNFYVFMALRFFVGALEQGVNITGFIMATELFPPKQRTIFGVAHEFLWAIGGAVLPVMAYFLRQWRHLQLAVSAPGILAIALWWCIPESVVWLTAKGRLKEAEDILERAARFNNRPLPPNCLSDQEASRPMLNSQDNSTGGCSGGTGHDEKVEKEKLYTIIDLFRTPQLRKITICLCSLWAINTMVYYGLSYNTPNLYGDMYLNFFIGQMVEIPSVAATLFLIYRVGRRWPLCIFHVCGGIVCIIAPFIPKETESGMDLTWLSVTLAMLGKFAINASFTIIYIYGPEIYPTVVRNTGSGLASSSGRVGGILYPFVNYLSKFNVGALGRQWPLLIFGILSVAGGFLALPLPETRHHPLPDTIDDVENYDEFCKRAHRYGGSGGAGGGRGGGGGGRDRRGEAEDACRQGQQEPDMETIRLMEV